MEYTDGKLLTVNVADEMQQSYLDYAMSVIVSRALPDVRDGLKPVHRRILYAMREAGNTPDRPFKKSARTVGDVLGKYHPHGDSAVYDALVRLAQDFSMRHPLIQGHGNFGSIDGDPPAAMRYTEARLSPLAMEMLRDLDKETVDFVPNFDGEYEEPAVLPSRFPNLLVNGAAGIAVGMATNIPPHNLGEVIDGVNYLIDHPGATSEDLMKIIHGPDFPTGGLIVGREGIREAYKTGRSIITMRARARIEEMKNGKTRILVTEIPYQVNKAKLIERIAELVRDKKIEGITDLRDETDRTGMRVVIELSRGTNPNVILNKLYKMTPLQQNFGIIMLALADNKPKILTLRQVLEHYLDHQKEVIVRRSRYELRKAEERAHILEGYRIALDNIDEVIALIRGSQTTAEAKEGLMERFKLSEVQAQAILDMRLQRLTGLEREKIEAEYEELLKTIEYLKAVLQSERMVLNIIKQELTEIRDKFADERRTQIVAGEADFEIEDLIAEEDIVVTLTHQGYIKRLPLSTYRSQRRGGRGISGLNTRDDDFVEQLFITTTHYWILFFTNRGRVYRIKAHEIPEAGRAARGTAAINLIEIEPEEKITTVMPIRHFDDEHFLTMVTRNGIVKRTRLSEYDTNRRGGLIAVALEEDDELIGVRLTDGNSDIILGSRRGMAIRFAESDVREMGRTARGVIGIRLDPGDEVVGMDVVDPKGDVLVVTEKGLGKRTAVEEYRPQGRGGKGLKSANLTERTGPVVGLRMVKEGGDVILISAQGVVIRQPVDEISRLGRLTQGVHLMRLDEGDKCVAVARVPSRDEEEQATGGEADEGTGED